MTDTIEESAAKLAFGLGIPMFVRDGRIYQNGPGKEFLPPKGALPSPLGSPEVVKPTEQK